MTITSASFTKRAAVCVALFAFAGTSLPGFFREAGLLQFVAPAYAKHRSKLAKDIGLGKSRSRGRG